MARIMSWWDELQKVMAGMEPPVSHSSLTMAKGQKNQVIVYAKQY